MGVGGMPPHPPLQHTLRCTVPPLAAGPRCRASQPFGSAHTRFQWRCRPHWTGGRRVGAGMLPDNQMPCSSQLQEASGPRVTVHRNPDSDPELFRVSRPPPQLEPTEAPLPPARCEELDPAAWHCCLRGNTHWW